MVRELQGKDESSVEGIKLWQDISKRGIEQAVHLFGLFGTQQFGYHANRVGGVAHYEDRTGIPAFDIRSIHIKKQ